MQKTVIAAAFTVFSVTFLQAKAVVYPIAPELESHHFEAKVDGQQTAVAHAATTYYFLNFSITGRTEISITAETEGYWAKGVEVQPWRWGIRPIVTGKTLTFSIDRPMKLSISRPGYHAAGAEMLFLFANEPEAKAPKTRFHALHYYGAGTYHENIDAKRGERIYLAPGAVVFGGLNIWGVENVKVSGRGTIVYDGPQDPKHDEGWMHKPNWHGIVMDHARHIEIDGITVIVRSRTWMIQMLSSRDIKFNNVKVIGGCPGNANQDGIDWLGGGDAVISDSFFRASDDIFALYGNWLGYDPKSIATAGETVDHILVENSVLSTSISNVVRVSWPGKIFDSHDFTMRNSDVINMGKGGCKVPFGLLEIWADPGGRGQHRDYSFENIRLEDWYSLLQLRQQSPAISGVRLKNVWALGNPALVKSEMSGDVTEVRLDNVTPTYTGGTGPRAAFTFSQGAILPGTKVTFDASSSTGEIKRYEWIFGDGSRAEGRVVEHQFPDSKGTFVDDSGRFRVLLKVTDGGGEEDWSYQPVVVTDRYLPAVTKGVSEVQYSYYEGADKTPITSGLAKGVNVEGRKRDEDYSFVFDGYITAPVDGGYTFLLTGNDSAELQIDSTKIAVSPEPQAQVCGMKGNMAQLAAGSVGLKAGVHKFHVTMNHSTGPDGFSVQWQGPGVPLRLLE